MLDSDRLNADMIYEVNCTLTGIVTLFYSLKNKYCEYIDISPADFDKFILALNILLDKLCELAKRVDRVALNQSPDKE